MAEMGQATRASPKLSRRPKHIKKDGSFPHVGKDNHSVESDRDSNYNCIAYAAGVTTIKWWPVHRLDAYWPRGVPYGETLKSFTKAFETLGYAECPDGSFVEGMEKIALYTSDGSREGTPTHAARQIGPDTWASKLGNSYDIYHKEGAISGGVYGEIAAFMQRPKQT